jgi:hypothetical protein
MKLWSRVYVRRSKVLEAFDEAIKDQCIHCEEGHPIVEIDEDGVYWHLKELRDFRADYKSLRKECRASIIQHLKAEVSKL